MKIKYIIFLFVLCFSVFSQTDIPKLTFNISAEKEFKSDMISLEVEVAKSSNDFVKAAEACNELISEIKKNLLKEGLNEEDFISKNIQNLPNDTFFKKDYTSRGLLSIKIRNVSDFYKYSEMILDSDKSVKILDTSFEIQNPERIKPELLEIAWEKIKKNKEAYERIFGVKLELYSVRDFFNEVNIYQTRAMKSDLMYESAYGQSEINTPIKKYNINLEIVFKLRHNY